jgi:hypothetical protein
MVLLLASFLIAGFTNPSDKNPKSSRSGVTSNNDGHINVPPPSPNTLNLYTDHFDGPNDTTSLKARGYKVWYRGTGPQGLTATWFTPDGSVFPAYEGPTTGFVAANYNVVTNVNNIDSWLVLPYQPGGYIIGDSLSFWTRTESASIWPDSITISYSATGDSIPEGTWLFVGKFKVPLTAWTNFSFAAPVTSPVGRFAIRYKVVNGGPNGANSDYIGIDLVTTSRSTVGITPISSEIPKNYSLSQNYPNPFNPSTKLNFGIPKSGNVKLAVYDVLGNEVSVVLNESLQSGNYSINFNASNLSSGIYFYRLIAGDFSQTMKMTLIK